MVRLKDIAAASGVSVMTVSKVMRDAPDISTATKSRIRQLAEQMGYVPDSMAQSLRRRTTHLFGLIVPAANDPVSARMMMAIEEQAAELGYEVLLAQSMNQPEREHAIVRRMLARRVDGLFITPAYRLAPTAPIYEELAGRGLPTVLLGPRAAFCQKFACVETDDQAGSAALTKHFLQLGHRRIAYLTGPNAVPATGERLEGYRHALRDAQLKVEDALLFTAGSTIEEGARAAAQMLAENCVATAVQAHNDLVAIGVATCLLQRGVRIPEDISVGGFGNILLSEYFRVPLTTVSIPKHRLGVAAMGLMKQLLLGQKPAHCRLPTELVLRASTAPPATAAVPMDTA